MNIVKKKLSELREAAYNPRQRLSRDSREYNNIRQALEKYGQVEPIIYNKATGNIVGGSRRADVMRDMGYEEVDCVELEIDLIQEKQLNVTLNKVEGRWDNDKLKTLLLELDTVNMAEDTGFERWEIEGITFDAEQIKDELDTEVIEAEEQAVEQTFNLTLTFDMADKPDIDEYIKLNGKEGIVEAIIRRVEGEV